MTNIEWRPEFAIGIPDVDHEHQELINWINRTLATLGQTPQRQSGVTGLLGEIFAKISAHFALEERVMKSRQYDQFTEHKLDHEQLLDDIREMMDDYETGTGTAGDEFSARLTDWFSQHFKTHDARFHRSMPPA